MPVNKIQLPDFLIADLYKSSLVELDTFTGEQHPVKEQKLASAVELKAAADNRIAYLGDNEKNIVVVVNQPEAVYLKEEDLLFLTNILKACQLTLTDIAIVNTATKEATYTAIKEQLSAFKLLLFDVEPTAIKLPFLIPPFQVQNFAGSAIMLAPALSALNKPTADGKLLKTRLWASLQQIFGIS